MCITALFKSLGAPLRNPRWSWGSVRASDGAVFLRVWQNETIDIENKTYIRLTHIAYFQNSNPNNLGYRERMAHVRLVEAGATTYLILCEPRNVNVTPRTIKSFNSKELFLGGKTLKIDGDTWLEVKAKVSVDSVKL